MSGIDLLMFSRTLYIKKQKQNKQKNYPPAPHTSADPCSTRKYAVKLE